MSFSYINLVRYIIGIILLLINSIYDIKNKKINIVSCRLVFIICLCLDVFMGIFSFKNLLYSLLIGGIVILISVISKGEIGVGDGIILSVVTYIFGIKKLVIILSIAVFLSGIVALYKLVIKKCSRKDKMPFVPYILLGTIVKVCILL